jgi:hypothetical protein
LHDAQEALDVDNPVHESLISFLSSLKGNVHVQTTSNNDDIDKNEIDDDKERAKGRVDCDYQEEESRDHVDEDEKLVQANGNFLDDYDDYDDAVMVRARHGALAVPRPRGDSLQAHHRSGDQRDDIVAGTLDGRHRDVIVGDTGVLREKRNFSKFQDILGKSAKTN